MAAPVISSESSPSNQPSSSAQPTSEGFDQQVAQTRAGQADARPGRPAGQPTGQNEPTAAQPEAGEGEADEAAFKEQMFDSFTNDVDAQTKARLSKWLPDALNGDEKQLKTAAMALTAEQAEDLNTLAETMDIEGTATDGAQAKGKGIFKKVAKALIKTSNLKPLQELQRAYGEQALKASTPALAPATSYDTGSTIDATKEQVFDQFTEGLDEGTKARLETWLVDAFYDPEDKVKLSGVDAQDVQKLAALHGLAGKHAFQLLDRAYQRDVALATAGELPSVVDLMMVKDHGAEDLNKLAAKIDLGDGAFKQALADYEQSEFTALDSWLPAALAGQGEVPTDDPEAMALLQRFAGRMGYAGAAPATPDQAMDFLKQSGVIDKALHPGRTGEKNAFLLFSDTFLENTLKYGGKNGAVTGEMVADAARIAEMLLGPDDGTDAPGELQVAGLQAALLHRTDETLARPQELLAASGYINKAETLTEQKTRLVESLLAFHVREEIGTPPMTAQQWAASYEDVHPDMLDELGSRVFNSPTGEKMQIITQHLGVPGDHSFMIDKKRKIKIENDDLGNVESFDQKKKKKKLWKKILDVAVPVIGTVLTFVPGMQAVGMGINAAYSAYKGAEAIRDGDILGGVLGIATAFVPGSKVLQVASGALKTYRAIEAKDWMGAISGGIGTLGAAFGGKNLQTAQRAVETVEFSKNTIDAIEDGDWLNAISNGLGAISAGIDVYEGTIGSPNPGVGTGGPHGRGGAPVTNPGVLPPDLGSGPPLTGTDRLRSYVETANNVVDTAKIAKAGVDAIKSGDLTLAAEALGQVLKNIDDLGVDLGAAGELADNVQSLVGTAGQVQDAIKAIKSGDPTAAANALAGVMETIDGIDQQEGRLSKLAEKAEEIGKFAGETKSAIDAIKSGDYIEAAQILGGALETVDGLGVDIDGMDDLAATIEKTAGTADQVRDALKAIKSGDPEAAAKALAGVMETIDGVDGETGRLTDTAGRIEDLGGTAGKLVETAGQVKDAIKAIENGDIAAAGRAINQALGAIDQLDGEAGELDGISEKVQQLAGTADQVQRAIKAMERGDPEAAARALADAMRTIDSTDGQTGRITEAAGRVEDLGDKAGQVLETVDQVKSVVKAIEDGDIAGAGRALNEVIGRIDQLDGQAGDLDQLGDNVEKLAGAADQVQTAIEAIEDGDATAAAEAIAGVIQTLDGLDGDVGIVSQTAEHGRQMVEAIENKDYSAAAGALGDLAKVYDGLDGETGTITRIANQAEGVGAIADAALAIEKGDYAKAADELWEAHGELVGVPKTEENAALVKQYAERLDRFIDGVKDRDIDELADLMKDQILAIGEKVLEEITAPTDAGDPDVPLAELQEADVMAQLSADAYNDEAGGPLPEGYSRLDANEFAELGINPALLSNDKGYFAALYKDGDGNYVLANRGTEPTHPNDWIANIGNNFGLETAQYQDAAHLARELVKAAKKEGKDVTFTGHSLGGGLASVQALATEKEAVTFNATGVSKPMLARLDMSREAGDDLITAFQVDGEILTGVQEGALADLITAPIGDFPEAVGEKVVLQPVGFDGEPLPATEAFFGSIELHKMPAILTSLQSLIQRQTADDLQEAA